MFRPSRLLSQIRLEPIRFTVPATHFLSPLPATLTSCPQLIENTVTLSPVVAALTDYVTPKSCVCHSYKKLRGVGVLPPILARTFSIRCSHAVLDIQQHPQAILFHGDTNTFRHTWE